MPKNLELQQRLRDHEKEHREKFLPEQEYRKKILKLSPTKKGEVKNKKKGSVSLKRQKLEVLMDNPELQMAVAAGRHQRECKRAKKDPKKIAKNIKIQAIKRAKRMKKYAKI